MKKFRTIFMGTPEFSVPCLEALTECCEVIGVITQPDKPRGRGQRLQPSPVKVCAEKHGIPVYQPEKIKTEEFTTRLEEMKPDLIVVVAFGQILSQRILDIPEYGCINVHASLLPRYRGAAPMQWCLINGESKTGITTMFMDAGLDTGDMLLKHEIEISDSMNLSELHDRMMTEGAKLLTQTLKQLSEGTLIREKQEDSDSCYAPMLNKETGRIDWSKSASEIHNLVRGLDSWPGAYTFRNGEKYKIWRTMVEDGTSVSPAGEILQADSHGLLVSTGNGLLRVLELQAPGGKRMPAGDYLRGHGIALPARFED
ncbi:MAG TPA: methionyl-tRNA formyltransferase [Selenomonas sp.]|nr:methionyl-tRNA formyltransferase [Selenomonas sp.]